MSKYDGIPCDYNRNGLQHPDCNIAHKRIKLEERIVRKLIRSLKEAGWNPVQVWDGEGIVVTTNETQTLDAVFSVDESTVVFQLRTQVRNQRVRHSVQIVLGNGIDCIVDYTYSENGDTFNETMEAITDAIEDQFEDEDYE